jgi:hypothetical protein
MAKRKSTNPLSDALRERGRYEGASLIDEALKRGKREGHWVEIPANTFRMALGLQPNLYVYDSRDGNTQGPFESGDAAQNMPMTSTG